MLRIWITYRRGPITSSELDRKRICIIGNIIFLIEGLIKQDLNKHYLKKYDKTRVFGIKCDKMFLVSCKTENLKDSNAFDTDQKRP